MRSSRCRPPRQRSSLSSSRDRALRGLTSVRPAAAQATAVLPDLAAPPELSVEAAAVSLLLRSYLKTGERHLVPRHELALAIEAFTGRAPRGSLTVSNDLAPRLAEQLGADRILVAQLQSSAKRLTATGLIYGPAGKRVGRISVGAAMGELGDMARQIAERLAPAIGATVVDGPAVGLADLRPFVAAQAALLVGDAAAAARAIEVALPNTAAPSARRAGRPPLRGRGAQLAQADARAGAPAHGRLGCCCRAGRRGIGG